MQSLFVSIFLIFIASFSASLSLAQDDHQQEVELHSFWVSPGEQQALQQIIKQGKNNNLNITVIKHNDYDILRNHIADRLAIGYPPDISHWVASEDLSGTIANGLIRPLPSISNGDSLEDILQESIYEEIVSEDGRIYFLPVGVHLLNATIYNLKVLDSLGFSSPPDNWDDFFSMVKRAQDAGLIPIALSDDPWLVRLLFTCVLLSLDDYQPIEMMFNRKLRDQDQLTEYFRKAMEIFLKIRDVADPNHVDRYWADATKLVINGEAVMQFIGDYARSEVITLAEKDVNHFECVAPPGNKVTMWDLDVFLLYSTQRPNEDGIARSLTDTVLNPKTQAEYIYYKGGLPVINPVNFKNRDKCAQSSWSRWHNTQKKLNVSSPFERNLSIIPLLRHELSEIWRDHDITATVAAKNLYNAIVNLEN